MFIILFVIVGIVAIGFLIASIYMSEGSVKKYIITSNTILLGLMFAMVLFYIINAFSNAGLAEKYFVEQKIILPYSYQGEVAGYTVIKLTGFMDDDYFAVPEELVQVDPACKVIRQVVLYCEDDGLTYGDYLDLGNDLYAYQCDNIKVIKPDYLFAVILGVSVLSVLFTVNALIGMVIALIQLFTKKKTKE